MVDTNKAGLDCKTRGQEERLIVLRHVDEVCDIRGMETSDADGEREKRKRRRLENKGWRAVSGRMDSETGS